MPRRPAELSIRPPLVARRRPPTPGADTGPTPLAGPAIPIAPEQDEALLARYEQWKAQYNGSLPEYLVWVFLTIDKKQIPGLDFVFQSPMFGGRTRFGGFVLDFYFPMRLEAWRVMGERWHLEQPVDRARDGIMAMVLTGQGLKVIDLWEDDLLSRRDFVLNLAWDQSSSVISRAPL